MKSILRTVISSSKIKNEKPSRWGLPDRIANTVNKIQLYMDEHDKKHYEFVMNYELKKNDVYMVTMSKKILFLTNKEELEELVNKNDFVSIDIHNPCAFSSSRVLQT